MTRALRAGVVGCGFFAQNHLHAWAGLDEVEIAAVCDRDAAKAERARSDFGAASAYTDATAMLEAERLDFVDLATTVESHRALVELAAAHRLPVICQKPFGHDPADCRAMVEACERAGVPLMVHENFRWQSPLMAVKEVLDEGAVGHREERDVEPSVPARGTKPWHVVQDSVINIQRHWLECMRS